METRIIASAALFRLILVTLALTSYSKAGAAAHSCNAPLVTPSVFGIPSAQGHNFNQSKLLRIRGGDSEEQADAQEEEVLDDDVVADNDVGVEADVETDIDIDSSNEEVGQDDRPINDQRDDIISDDNDQYVSEYDDEEEILNQVNDIIDDDDDTATAASNIGVEVMIQEEEANATDDGDDTDDNGVTEINIADAQDNASQLRVEGKAFHDAGDFDQAGETFQKAAIELEDVIASLKEKSSTGLHVDVELSKLLIEERATCRLHEALCHLKNKKYAESIASCTSVLMDGVEVIEDEGSISHDDSLAKGEGEGEEEGEEEGEGEDENEHSEQSSSIVRICVNSNADDSAGSDTAQLSPAVRARAYHRRAKARLALGDTEGALDDSRSAAFLGDRNAVALYGRLMRESAGAGGRSPFDGNGSSGMDGLFGPSSPFESMFSGGSPFTEGGSDSSPMGSGSMGLLSSLLGSGSGPGVSDGSSDTTATPMPFNPLSMLGSMNGSNSDGGGMGGLAKSVLASVAKRAEDEDMQATVCNYLNALDTAQIISLSSMAGMPLSQGTAERLVSFANRVTPRGIGKSVKLTKRILFVGALVRKIFKIIGKYKHIIVLVVLIGWTKSAIQRPIVIKRVVEKATEATISKAAFFI